MNYFYDYFARQYQESRSGKLLPAPAAVFQGIKPEDVKSCRRVLKSSFVGYRDSRNTEVLKRLLGEYRDYISRCHEEHAKDRYNAFVYRYMMEIPVGNRAIATKLGVVKETVLNYIDRCIEEMLMLCMGLSAVIELPRKKEVTVRMLINGSKFFCGMTGDYVLCLFSEKREQVAVEMGRQITKGITEQFTDAVREYFRYCNDENTSIDTDIRKAGVLEKCLDGISVAAIAKEYRCCESTIYADIRENERRLAAMLFDWK